jgi:hypothetical protein
VVFLLSVFFIALPLSLYDLQTPVYFTLSPFVVFLCFVWFLLSSSHNLVAFYDDSDPSGKRYNSMYASHNISIDATCNGKQYHFVALIADTCGNQDCNGCCSRNSNKQTGYLIDIEYYTAMNVFGTTDCASGNMDFTVSN